MEEERPNEMEVAQEKKAPLKEEAQEACRQAIIEATRCVYYR